MTTALLAILLATAAGAAFLLITRIETDLTALAGSSILVGFVLVTLAMLVVSAAGREWTPLSVSSVTLLLVGAAIMVRSREPYRLSMPSIAWGDLASMALIVVHALYVTESAPRDRDYWGMFGLKAKVFAEGGQELGWRFLTDPLNTTAHIDYPPLLNFMFDWIASWQETWSDRWFGLLEVFFVVALVLIVRSRTSFVYGSTVVGSWTAAMAALMIMQTRFGIADVPLTVFVTSGLLVLQHAISTGQDDEVPLGFILLGGGALTKNEGLVFLVISLLVALLLTRRWRFMIRSSLAGIVVAAFWQLPRIVMGLRADIAEEGGLSRILARLVETDWLIMLVKMTPPAMIAAVIGVTTTAFIARRRLKEAPLLLLVPLGQLMVYLGVYASSPHPAAWHVKTSWDRIALHIALPWLVVSVAALVDQIAKWRLTGSSGDAGPAPSQP